MNFLKSENDCELAINRLIYPGSSIEIELTGAKNDPSEEQVVFFEISNDKDIKWQSASPTKRVLAEDDQAQTDTLTEQVIAERGADWTMDKLHRSGRSLSNAANEASDAANYAKDQVQDAWNYLW